MNIVAYVRYAHTSMQGDFYVYDSSHKNESSASDYTLHSLYTCPQKKGSFLICAPVGMSGSPEPAPFGTPVVSPVPLTCVGHLPGLPRPLHALRSTQSRRKKRSQLSKIWRRVHQVLTTNTDFALFLHRFCQLERCRRCWIFRGKTVENKMKS